jgi:hypothetical protein
MLRFVFLVIVIVFVKALTAQSVSLKEYVKHKKKIQASANDSSILVSLDTMYIAGKAIAVLHAVAGTDKDYSVKNLSGNELMYFRFNSFNNPEFTSNIGSTEKSYYYELIFRALKKDCEVPFMTLQEIAGFIVTGNLIANGVLNTASADSLTALYGKKVTQQQSIPVAVFKRDGEATDYAIIQRDKTAMIILRNNTIEQDGKTIGYMENKSEVVGAITYYTYYILLPGGKRIAEARHQSYGNEYLEIQTSKDSHIIRIVKPAYEVEKAILRYLIDNAYL